VTVRKKPNGKWFARKWVRLPDGTRERVFVMPKDYGLPNTRVAAEEALRRRVTEVVEGRAPKTPPPKPSKVPTLASFSETYLEHSGAKNKPSSLDSKRQILPRSKTSSTRCWRSWRRRRSTTSSRPCAACWSWRRSAD
jgi:hypothetical protein